MKDYIRYAIPLGGVVFWSGIQTSRIDELFRLVTNAEADEHHRHNVILDMHGRLCKMEQAIKKIDEINTRLHNLDEYIRRN